MLPLLEGTEPTSVTNIKYATNVIQSFYFETFTKISV